MINIGFDLVLEAEQRHKELRNEVEKYRLANGGIAETQYRVPIGYKLLARIGNQIASLGTRLEERYGDKAQAEIVVNHTVNPDDGG